MKAPRPEPTIYERATYWVGSPASVVVHTGFFVFSFFLGLAGLASWDRVLLVLTTLVSLEAIYLAIFIQMSVNRQAAELAEVSEDIDEIQEDIDEIQEDVDEIQEDVEDISEDVEEMSEDDAPAPALGAVVDGRPGVDHVLAEVKKILKELEELREALPKPAAADTPAVAVPPAPKPSVPLARKIASVLKGKKPKPKKAADPEAPGAK